MRNRGPKPQARSQGGARSRGGSVPSLKTNPSPCPDSKGHDHSNPVRLRVADRSRRGKVPRVKAADRSSRVSPRAAVPKIRDSALRVKAADRSSLDNAPIRKARVEGRRMAVPLSIALRPDHRRRIGPVSPGRRRPAITRLPHRGLKSRLWIQKKAFPGEANRELSNLARLRLKRHRTAMPTALDRISLSGITAVP